MDILDQASVSFWEQDKIAPGRNSLLAMSALLRNSAEAPGDRAHSDARIPGGLH